MCYNYDDCNSHLHCVYAELDWNVYRPQQAKHICWKIKQEDWRERTRENALLDLILELRKVKQKDKFVVVVVVPKQVIKIDFLLDFYWDFTLASYCSHFSSIRFLL